MRSAVTGPMLVGRAPELDALADVVRQAEVRGAGAVLVEGEAGIGKTRLVEEVVDDFRRSGVLVLSAAAQELERGRPFGAVSDALGLLPSSSDARRAEIARLLWEADPAESVDFGLGAGPSVRYRVVEAIVDLVESMAATRSCVLVVEDLHWADPSSLLTCHTLVRRLRDLPLVLLGTFRPTPRPAELEAAVEGMILLGARHLVLSPLDVAAVESLAARLVGAPPGPALRTQLARAEGNPFYVIELLRTLLEEKAIEVRDGRAEASATRLPESLRVTVLRRLRYLSDATVDALRLSAILGRSFEVAQLATVTGRSVVELLGVLDEAVRAKILGDAGERLTFRHDLIWETLYSDLSPAIRKGLHLEVGRALARGGAPATQVAEHLALGAEPGDPEAVEWLREAARANLSLAPATSAELLERALKLAPPSDVRDELVSELVVALFYAGRVRDAEDRSRRALSGPLGPLAEAVVRFGLVMSLFGQGRMAEAGEEAAAAIAQPDAPLWVRAELEAHGSFGPLFLGELAAARQAADSALRHALDAGDDLAACVAMSVSSLVPYFQGHTAEAIRLAREAVDYTRRSTSKSVNRWHTRLILGVTLLDADRLEEAEDSFQSGYRLSEEHGVVFNLPFYHCAFSWLRFLSGRWDDARAEIEAALTFADAWGMRDGYLGMQGVAAIIALHRNELERAEEALAEGEAEFPTGMWQFRSEWLLWARGLFEEARGQVPAAVDGLQRAWDLCGSTGRLAEYPLLGPDFVRLLMAGSEGQKASEVADEVGAVADRMEAPWATAAALRCRGLLTRDPDVSRQALAVLQGGRRPLERAMAAEEAAGALLASARVSEAVPLLDEALDSYAGLGAIRGVARVEAQLRTLGVRRGHRGPRRDRPKTGWAALTATEAQVVQLVADRLTNREVADRLYISPRTVETHLAHVFAKLGMSSRMQLRAEVLRRGADRNCPSGTVPVPRSRQPGGWIVQR